METMLARLHRNLHKSCQHLHPYGTASMCQRQDLSPSLQGPMALTHDHMAVNNTRGPAMCREGCGVQKVQGLPVPARDAEPQQVLPQKELEQLQLQRLKGFLPPAKDKPSLQHKVLKY